MNKYIFRDIPAGVFRHLENVKLPLVPLLILGERGESFGVIHQKLNRSVQRIPIRRERLQQNTPVEKEKIADSERNGQRNLY